MSLTKTYCRSATASGPFSCALRVWVYADALAAMPVLEDSDEVKRVSQVLGENTYCLEGGDGTQSLYKLPKRLRHVVFIRPGSFVFARDDVKAAERSRLAGEISAVVLDCHLKEMRKHARWPEVFALSELKKPRTVVPGPSARPGPADVVHAQNGNCDLAQSVSCSGSEESELEENPNQRRQDMYSDYDDSDTSHGN